MRRCPNRAAAGRSRCMARAKRTLLLRIMYLNVLFSLSKKKHCKNAVAKRKWIKRTYPQTATPIIIGVYSQRRCRRRRRRRRREQKQFSERQAFSACMCLFVCDQYRSFIDLCRAWGKARTVNFILAHILAANGNGNPVYRFNSLLVVAAVRLISSTEHTII